MIDLPTISTKPETAISKRFALVREKIEASMKRAGRRDTIVVVASSRGLMLDPVLDAAEAGIEHFIEDYVPEGVTKMPGLRHRFPNVQWHFGGTLPNNKLNVVVEFFDWIHSFDRETLLKPFQDACLRHASRTINVLLEVNPLGVQKKSGLPIQNIPYIVEQLGKIPNVRVKGLSCRCDLMMSKDLANQAYQKVAGVRDELISNRIFSSEGVHLAIGSSRDIEKAIQYGSTMLRVGSALFGKTAASTAIVQPF